MKTQPPLKALSKKQKIFAEEFSKCRNASHAARVAGYSNPKVTGHHLLQKSQIQAAIRRHQRAMEGDYEMRRGLILKELEDCALRKAGDFYDENGQLIENLKSLPENLQAAIDGITQTVTTRTFPDGTEVENVKTNLKLVPKASALDMALKHLGGYDADNSQRSEGTVVINFDELYASMNGSNGHAQPPEDPIEAQLLEIESQANSHMED